MTGPLWWLGAGTLVLLGAVSGGAGWRLSKDEASAPALFGSALAARAACWTLPLAMLTLAWQGLPWWLAVAVGVGAFAGASVGTFDAIDAGYGPTATMSPADAMLVNAGRGYLTAMPMAMALVAMTYHAGVAALLAAAVLSLCGAAVGPAYTLATLYARRHPPLQPTMLAEVAMGALLGGGLAAGLLLVRLGM